MVGMLRSKPAATIDARGSALFVRRSVRHPQQICSVFPSSPYVGRAMARAIADRPVPGVVELGAGSGPVTRELLSHGVERSDLTLVEIDRTLSAYLKRSFRGVEVLNTPAQDLSARWLSEGRDKVGGVVSTLPFKIFNQVTMDAVIASTFDILEAGGRFVQFTYRFTSPVPRTTIDRFGLEAWRSEIVWPNVPPASIWVYARR